MKPLVKICGMKDAENAARVAELAPDFIGFIFSEDSPRFIAPSEAALISDFQSVRRVGVFVDEDLDRVLEVVAEARLDAVQLHGTETPEDCKQLKAKAPQTLLLKALQADADSIDTMADRYSGFVDYLLFDTPSAARGGSGRTFDWSLLRDTKIDAAFFLSGGLDETMVAQACTVLRGTRLAGFDLNSRLEVTPGVKDLVRTAAAIEEVKGIDF